jgi:hypothetical protein
MERDLRHIAARLPIIAIAASLTVACSSREEPPVDPNPFPADYKAAIVKFIPKVVNDPSNIRNASVSDPTFMQVAEQPRYFVCVRFTPKETAAQYATPEERLALFFGGQINQFTPATPEQCGKVSYKPFPELERIVCVQGNCRGT